MLSTALSYQLVSRDLTRSLANVASEATVKRAGDYYSAHIGDVKGIDDFLANDRLYRYAMKAFGLEDMTYAKAFMRKVLEGGIDGDEAFANKLSDKRYRDFAEAFNFKRYGEATTSFDRAGQGTVDRYLRQTLEEKAGAQNEGVRLALYFQRKAPTIASALSILADPALLKVVQTALSIPAASGSMDIDKQAALITRKLDLADLKDPTKLAKFLTRFTNMYEIANGGTAATAGSAASSAALNLISPRTTASIGIDLLQSLQKLRLGGL